MMTACVVGDFRSIRPGGRRRGALTIRSRSTGGVHAGASGAARGKQRPGCAGARCDAAGAAGLCSTIGVRAGLHEERPQRLLEGGDGTVGVGEGGLEVCEDMRRWPVLRRQLRRQAAPRQCRADVALGDVEAFPDALPSPVAEIAGGAAGGADTVADGALEKPPQRAARQAEASDFVGEPDAEGPPAAATCLAVAAKDPPGARRRPPPAAVVKAVQQAVANQRAHDLAAWTGRLFEPLGDAAPFLVAAIKPSLLAHGGHASRKIVILRRGTAAG